MREDLKRVLYGCNLVYMRMTCIFDDDEDDVDQCGVLKKKKKEREREMIIDTVRRDERDRGDSCYHFYSNSYYSQVTIMML